MRKDYSHRKKWFTERIKLLGKAFALDVQAYSIMSNHFHLVVYYDPKANQAWNNEEVVDRWLSISPSRLPDGSIDESMNSLRREELIGNPEQLARIRSNLGSLSVFMKLLKQPIARRANREDNTSGHFFDQRFYSGALLNEAAVLAAMAYVDLNPIRAEIVKTIEEANHTSVQERLAQTVVENALDEYLQPLISGLKSSPRINTTLRDYLSKLRNLTALHSPPSNDSKLNRWRAQVSLLKRKQRVFGNADQIKKWISERGMQMREQPLPD